MPDQTRLRDIGYSLTQIAHSTTRITPNMRNRLHEWGCELQGEACHCGLVVPTPERLASSSSTQHGGTNG